MRILSLAAAIASSLLATAAFAADDAAPPAQTALHCGHLIDTDAGKLLGASTIVIEGDKVKEVRSGRVDVAGAKVVELNDATCLPGLIDSHTHLTSQTSPTRVRRPGVPASRSPGRRWPARGPRRGSGGWPQGGRRPRRPATTRPAGAAVGSSPSSAAGLTPTTATRSCSGRPSAGCWPSAAGRPTPQSAG